MRLKNEQGCGQGRLPLVQLGKPKVQFACASALAMLVEGQPETCPQVLRHGGVAALTIMLQTAGAQGRKAAAEALQVDTHLSVVQPFISGLPGLCTVELRTHSSDWLFLATANLQLQTSPFLPWYLACGVNSRQTCGF